MTIGPFWCRVMTSFEATWVSTESSWSFRWPQTTGTAVPISADSPSDGCFIYHFTSLSAVRYWIKLAAKQEHFFPQVWRDWYHGAVDRVLQHISYVVQSNPSLTCVGGVFHSSVKCFSFIMSLYCWGRRGVGSQTKFYSHRFPDPSQKEHCIVHYLL